MVEDVREHARPIAMAHDQHVRRRRPRREVDDVGDPAGVLEAADDANGFGGDRLLRLICRRADVVRAVDVRRARPDRLRIAGRRGRLLGEDVEPDPQALSRATPRRAPRDRRSRPRAVLMNIAPGFSCASTSRLTRPFVSAPNARWTLRMSARAATSAGVGASSSRIVARRLEAEFPRLLVGHRPILRRRTAGSRRPRRMPKPAARRITSCRCCRCRARRASGRAGRAPSRTPSCSTCRRASSATLSGIRRSRARINAEGQLRDGDGVLAGAFET